MLSNESMVIATIFQCISIFFDSYSCLFFCFFFSSRRRHTRYIGDWSSDVCSSDLAIRDSPARTGRDPCARSGAASRGRLFDERGRGMGGNTRAGRRHDRHRGAVGVAWMRALTAAEMRDVDRLTTERFGVPSQKLMEAAGRRVADAVIRELGDPVGVRVAVLCGKGNNGGDGLVAARHLKTAGADAAVFLFGRLEEMKGEAGENLRRWRESSAPLTVIGDSAAWGAAWKTVATAAVIVDGLLGTGVRGSAEGLLAQAIEDINRLSRNATATWPRLILAVDMPSGLPSDGQEAAGPVVRVHRTVTFTAPKLGQLISRDAPAVRALEVRST